jgi:integrase
MGTTKNAKSKAETPATVADKPPKLFYRYLIDGGRSDSTASLYTRIVSRWADYEGMLAYLASRSHPDAAEGTMCPLISAANHWCDWMSLPRSPVKYRWRKVDAYLGLIVTRVEALDFLDLCPPGLSRLCAQFVLETGLRGNSLVAITLPMIADARASKFLRVRGKRGKLIQLRVSKRGCKILKKINKLGGFPPNEETLRRHWRACRAGYTGPREDIKSWKMHTFRHAFATELARRGARERALQEILGHSDPKTTARYVHHIAIDDAMQLLE